MTQSKRIPFKRSVTVAALLAALLAGYGAANEVSTPMPTDPTATDPITVGPVPAELPPQETDLSIRFTHLEPALSGPGLIACWPFDEGSGYAFGDLSGGGHTAYITGSAWNTTDSGLTASFHRQGKRAGAVYLNGSQWLQVQDAPALHPAHLSLSAWIKLDAAPNGQTVLAKMAGDQGYRLALGDDASLRFSVGDGQAEVHELASEAGAVRQGEWVHVVATSDASTGEMRLYIDGALAVRADGEPFAAGTAAEDLRIGSDPDGSSGFKGWLDEVSLHGRVVDAREARGLYAVGFPKLYIQTRETIDADKAVWTRYKGPSPIPHPLEADTVFAASYDGALASSQGQHPSGYTDEDDVFVPGAFGGAFDAVAHTGGLVYPSPLTSDRGTLELWFVPVLDGEDPERAGKKVLFRAEGEDGWLELFSRDGRWAAALSVGSETPLSVESEAGPFAYGTPVHLGVTWGGDETQELVLFINGAEVARQAGEGSGAPVFDRELLVGGRGAEAAHGYVDDLRVSSEIRAWGEIAPRGHLHTESSPLDLRDGFDRGEDEALTHWRPGTAASDWRYALKPWEDGGEVLGDSGEGRRSLKGSSILGEPRMHTLFHPDAYGHMASVEAGVSFEEVADGWAGVFIASPTGPGETFSGYTFTLNPAANSMRLAAVRDGETVASKALPYDFALQAETTYTLTLTSTGDGVLRGYLDGHNLISLALPDDAVAKEGFAGLITDNAPAHFDDVHFTALTPATAESRQVQQRLFSGGAALSVTPGYRGLSLSAFRWHKRYGLLPWQRTYKNPEPPGAIFGADTGTVRPNPPAFWRSHDSANSELLAVDGTVYYFMRGNPHIGSRHGPAAIGVLSAEADSFTGIHFKDHNASIENLDEAELLRGHEDQAPREARDSFPRDTRFQVNDQGATYLDGKIIVMAREFRNRQPGYPWYRRLVFGVYDVAEGRWAANEGRPVDWSGPPDPADPFSPFSGLDATPELTALRDPLTDAYVLFLYHHHRTLPGLPTTGVTGLRFEGTVKPTRAFAKLPEGTASAVHRDDLVLHKDYPTRETYSKLDADTIYGERILFDNGIYYMHYNAGPDFDYSKLGGDWPDRFHLASSLHPYEGPWTTSAENHNPALLYPGR